VFVPPIFKVAPLATLSIPPSVALSAEKVDKSRVPEETVRLPIKLIFLLQVTPPPELIVRLLKLVAEEEPLIN
jgi:hypothetical protein